MEYEGSSTQDRLRRIEYKRWSAEDGVQIVMSNFNIAELANPGIRDLKVYVPGKTIEEVQREFGGTKIIKLASNENPLGPSPRALQAIQSETINLALYPDPSAFALKEKLSEKYLLPSNQFTIGNGSDEILNIIYRTFISSEHEVLLSQYGFAAFTVLANSNNVKIVVIPEKDYVVDLTATLEAITPKTRAIFIANPNNPTGTYLQSGEILAFLKKVPTNVLIILDEAYAEFVEQVGSQNSFSWIKEFPNLIITRTFSKAYGLAGLRIGFAVANNVATDLMNRVRQPFNVNTLGQIAAIAALDDTEHLTKTLQNNKQGLLQWQQALNEMHLSYIPSVCNFITVDFKQDTDAIFHKLLAQGVIVRPLKSYKMPHHLRITIGTEAENDRAIAALRQNMGTISN